MSEYRLYFTKIWETRLCSSDGYVFVIRVGLGHVLESSEQLRPDGIWAVFGEWVKLCLVCVLVGQIRFRLRLSDRSDWV